MIELTADNHELCCSWSILLWNCLNCVTVNAPAAPSLYFHMQISLFFASQKQKTINFQILWLDSWVHQSARLLRHLERLMNPPAHFLTTCGLMNTWSVRRPDAKVRLTKRRWQTQELSVNKEEGHLGTWSEPSHKLSTENQPRILMNIRYFQWAVPSQHMENWHFCSSAKLTRMQSPVEMLSSRCFLFQPFARRKRKQT